ncbi:MAG: hypothetical protein F6K09_02415 [Merismopedia sp. SIO2A8]|nr:hypothetical protein [Merismopedia sp. SIO2A8]
MVSPKSTDVSVASPSLTTPSPSPKNRTDLFFLMVGVVVNVMIWAIALGYLKLAKPTYTSGWAIALPGGGLTSNVDLPQIGSADTRVSSPFSNVNRDPRENYKFLATSRPVLKAAADALEMAMDDFGKPRVEIVDNTTLMELSMQGGDPDDAQQRAYALHDALIARVTHLREEEAAQQDAGSRAILEESREKLELAQQRLSEFKARTGLISNEQIIQLSNSIERLRERAIAVTSEQSNAQSRLQELSGTLQISADEAAQAFNLRADQLFQRSVQEYSIVSTSLESLNAQFGPNHPSVVRARGEQEAAYEAMIERGAAVLGQPIDPSTLSRLNVGSTQEKSSRELLFAETVTVHIQNQGLTAQSQALDQQTATLEEKLRTLAQYSLTLESLQRDVTIAEAVFSSTIARLDLGRSDVFGSYPHIQLLTDPSLPRETANPSVLFVCTGAMFASIFITAGIIVVWRQKFITI